MLAMPDDDPPGAWESVVRRRKIEPTAGSDGEIFDNAQVNWELTHQQFKFALELGDVSLYWLAVPCEHRYTPNSFYLPVSFSLRATASS